MGWRLTNALAPFLPHAPGDRCHGVMPNAWYSFMGSHLRSGRPLSLPTFGMALALHRGTAKLEVRGSMTVDGQVLVVAFLALSLNLAVWGAGQDVVQAKEELPRKDEFHLDFGRPRHSKVDKR